MNIVTVVRSAHVCAIAFVVLVSMQTTRAAAQKTENSFQLGLHTALVSYTKSTLEVDDTGEEADESDVHWGVRRQVRLEIGYGVGPMVVLGGLVVLGGDSQTIKPKGGEEREADDFSAIIAPKLDVLFVPGARVRPLLTLGLGLNVASTDNGTTETSWLGVAALGRIGLRCFASESFSIDPALALFWTTGSGEGKVDGQLSDVNLSNSGYSISLELGFSGWLE